MTEAELENMTNDPLIVDMDAWREEVSRLLHRRQIYALLEDGRLDVFDLLLIAPEIVRGIVRREATEEYRRRRLQYLEEIEIDWPQMREEEIA